MLNQSDQNCSTCKWWQRAAPKLAAAKRDPSASEALGTCQVNPPVIVQGNSPFPITMFPETHGDRFCGRWRPRSGGGDGGETVVPFKQREAA